MKIALFGCGRYFAEKSEQLLEQCKEDILYICDNNSQKWGGNYHSLLCVSPDKLIADMPYVIITLDSKEQEEQICRQCDRLRVQARSYRELVRERGYLTGWNQIDYPALLMSCALNGKDVGEELHKLKKATGKQLLMFYGNCQVGVLNALALTSTKIGEKYFVITIPPVQNLSANERETGIAQGVLDNLDVLFYQHVNFNNNFSRKLGSGAIVQQMALESQTTICIPNVYYDGYFPQMQGNKYSPTGVGEYAVGAGPFPGDANIEKMWDNHSPEEIYACLAGEDFHAADVVREKANASMEELKRREEICDVVISDYIRENFKKERLFFIPNHPKIKVIFELPERAFVKIGINADDMKPEMVKEPDMQVIPIYPSVRKALDLEFADNICYEPSLPEKPSDLKTYIAAYIKYCKPLWEREQNSMA